MFTQTNSTGSFQTEARFTDSWNDPVLVAPSPKKQTVMFGDFCMRWLSADPTAMGMPPPTIPFAPRLPTEKSAMCMHPPRPLQYPVSLPRNSAIIRSSRMPLPMLCPWPRWVAVMRSSGSRAAQTAMPVASSPMQKCAVPWTLPSVNSRAAVSSKLRVCAIRV